MECSSALLSAPILLHSTMKTVEGEHVYRFDLWTLVETSTCYKKGATGHWLAKEETLTRKKNGSLIKA